MVAVAVAGIGVAGWLVRWAGWPAFEPRFPRPFAIARLAPPRIRRRRADAAAVQDPDAQPDVELAVRERLYGRRPRTR